MQARGQCTPAGVDGDISRTLELGGPVGANRFGPVRRGVLRSTGQSVMVTTVFKPGLTTNPAVGEVRDQMLLPLCVGLDACAHACAPSTHPLLALSPVSPLCRRAIYPCRPCGQR